MGSQLEVKVPNILLQESYPINSFIYIQGSNDSAKTLYRIDIPVKPRTKPNTYEFEENINFIDLPEMVEEIKQLIEELSNIEGGADGEDGATFIPEVSIDGVISWTNDKGLTNPTPVNIKGERCYVHVRYADSDSPVSSNYVYADPDGHSYFGIYTGTSSVAPAHPANYVWASFKGEKGDTGAMPDITVGNVTTLEAGCPAMVTKRGTVDKPILDFGIPKGEPGSDATAIADDTIWYEIDLSQYTLVMGTIGTSGNDTETNTTRCKMRNPLFVYAGTKIKFHNDDSAKSATLHIYDFSTNGKGYQWAEYTAGFSEYVINRDCLIRLVFLNGTEDITEDTYGEMISSLTILSPKPPLQQIEGEPMPYFRKEIRDISQRVGKENGFKFPVFTDIHCYYPIYGANYNLGYEHFRNIKAISDKTHVDAVVSLGDMTMGYTYGSNTRDVHSMISEWSKLLPAPYLQAIGNHDENYYYAFGGSGRPNEILTPQEMASYYYHPNDIHRRSYFYHDFPEHKTRIIVLNSNDAYVLDENGNPKYNKEETNGSAAVTYAFMPQQVQWLAELLHKTEQDCKGWDIVVCSHQSVCPTGSGSTQIPKNTEVVWGLLTAFNSGGSYSKSISDGDFTVSVNETYNGDCQIACTVYGHKHYDRAFKENDIWNICVACSLCKQDNSSDNGATSPERTPYTVSEDAWDIFCITPEKIKTIRFGAGSDREFDR